MTNIPKDLHWAIVKISKTYYEGDERSKTHPGHGYPADYDENLLYIPYNNYETFKKEVEFLTKTRANFIAIEAKPFKVTTKIDIDLE